MSPATETDVPLGSIIPFMLGAADSGAGRSRIRGRLIRMDATVGAILGRHAYPPLVSALLGEALVLAAGLASLMEYDGIFTLQAKGDAAVRTLLADVTSDGAVRGYASADTAASVLADKLVDSGPQPARQLLGNGYLAMTVDQGEKGRYQGIIPLEQADLAGLAQAYFSQSEQIDTAVMLAVMPAQQGWRAGGLLLQRLAAEGGKTAAAETAARETGAAASRYMAPDDDPLWHDACVFMATCTRQELLADATAQDGAGLLYRLFHECGISMAEPRPLIDRCRCSPARIHRMLDGLPASERQQLADQDGQLVVVCEFCKKKETVAV